MNETECNAAAREIAQCYEDIRDKDAEIERLRNEIIVLQRNELYMKELGKRAAVALEVWHVPAKSLIDELRKAAE